MLVGVEILQSAIFLQQNKSEYWAGTQTSVFRKGQITPDQVCAGVYIGGKKAGGVYTSFPPLPQITSS